MEEIILKGHKVAKGKAEGEAIVTCSPMSFFGGINPETGIVVDRGHELRGQNLAGKILIFPCESPLSLSDPSPHTLTSPGDANL